MQSEKGFSLIEMMITLAISAIIIGAAFGSYTIISRNFEWQKDMKYISQSARNVIEMIQKDIRNAGFRFEANAAITDPVKIYDAGDCCDRIEIIYDETINKRVKIEYRLQQYSSDNSRFRLYKKKTNLSNNNTVEFDTPIADYIEALQFTGSRGDCVSGIPREGCGVEKIMTPISARYGTYGGGRNIHTCSDDILKIFDNNPNTYWLCDDENGEFKFNGPNHALLLEFAEEFRPIKAVIQPSLGVLNEGTFDTSYGQYYGRATGSYGPTNPSDPTYGCHFQTPCYLGAQNSWGKLKPTNLRTEFKFSRHILSDEKWKCIGISNPRITTNVRYPVSSHYCSDPNYEYDVGSYGPGGYNKLLPTESITKSFAYDGDHTLGISYSKYLDIEIRYGQSYRCAYDSSDEGYDARYMREGVCNWAPNTGRSQSSKYVSMSDIMIFGEVFSSMSPQEVEIELLQRSPREHGNTDRNFSTTIGNFSINVNDKFLRDNYLTSATMRNVYYQSP